MKKISLENPSQLSDTNELQVTSSYTYSYGKRLSGDKKKPSTGIQPMGKILGIKKITLKDTEVK